MKLTFLLILIQIGAFAQESGIELYAYEQKVIPGIAPARDIEEGGVVMKKPVKTEVQYYIFLTTPDSITVYPVSLWIKGQEYGVNIKETAAPVQQPSSADSTIVLVPETEQKIYRLFPVKVAPGKEKRGTVLAKQNDLVLVYKMKGKFFTLVKEDIERLDAVGLP